MDKIKFYNMDAEWYKYLLDYCCTDPTNKLFEMDKGNGALYPRCISKFRMREIYDWRIKKAFEKNARIVYIKCTYLWM